MIYIVPAYKTAPSEGQSVLYIYRYIEKIVKYHDKKVLSKLEWKWIKTTSING
jgi:hypothetical protein